MWKGLVGLCMLTTLASCQQEQFHREVRTPADLTEVSILRGGSLNGVGGNGVEQPPQSEERYVVDTQPQHGLPLQASPDQPIPENGGSNNPFTNGEAGFGLRLQAPVQEQQHQSQQPKPVQGTPILTHHQRFLEQPFPIFHQTPLILPQLPAGQLYVDNYGRTVVYTPPEPPTTQPPPPPPTTTQPPVTVHKQALVDEYGRQLAQFETHSVIPAAPAAVPVVQSTAVPVAQAVPVVHSGVVPVAPSTFPVVQHGVVPVAHTVVQPAADVPVAEVPLLAKTAPPPVALHTYAVPAVRRVGNLVIPYAQKVVFAKAPGAEVVLPPAVKHAHRILTPVGVAGVPIAQEVHVAPSAVHVETGPVLQQHVPVALGTENAPVLAQPPPHVIVEHTPEHHVQIHHEQPLAFAAPPSHVVAHSHPVAVTPVVAGASPSVLVKKHVEAVVAPAIVPDVSLIHQPVLSKVLFQRHIYNVKHGNDPIIYQDLCTVYPLQKNIRACLLKKAVLPELHHPDIRTLNIEVPPVQPQPDQSVITGGSPVAPPPPVPTVVVTRNPPKNIQETIKRESAKSRAAAAAAAAAAATTTSTSTTTVQPETAESRQTVTTKARRRRKNCSSTSPRRSPRSSSTKERAFKLGCR